MKKHIKTDKAAWLFMLPAAIIYLSVIERLHVSWLS